MRHILGISAFYHDSAAVLLREGEIVAATQEERFTRRKNDESFPLQACSYCLEEAGIGVGNLDAVVFYEKPILKFSRALETFLSVAPYGFRSFVSSVPGWLAEKLNMRGTIRTELQLPEQVQVLFSGHHEAHAASAFFPSPFEEAAILTVDGVGEYATTTIGRGGGNEIEMLEELHFPHSVGLLYSAFTVYCGFRVNSGEYKLMGLAPYGEPKYAEVIRNELLDLKQDGSFRLNMEYFDFLRGRRMTNEKFDQIFGGPGRRPESGFEQRHFDVARSIQQVTEEIIVGLARRARELSASENLCMAGGVALNCVANGRILREGIFERIWVQPAAGDAGGALGGALAAWHRHLSEKKEKCRKIQRPDGMRGALLGPGLDAAVVKKTLDNYAAVYTVGTDAEVLRHTAQLLAAGKVVGWVQGRMEFGPRALGNRSILGDARSPEMQRTLNLKVKQRESFRPFAPAVLRERTSEFFKLNCESPYMLLVAPVQESKRVPNTTNARGFESLNTVRSSIPAVTHVDYSARVQTVGPEENERFYELLKSFEKLTGCPVLVNTSFNIRGEPIVCSAEDAYRCFLQTEMDYLVIGNFILERGKQPAHKFVTRPILD
ncbi:MAG: carbamoyltransferase family protein [Limisphaerales bacterium]